MSASHACSVPTNRLLDKYYLNKKMSYFAKDRLKGKVAIVTASTDGIGFGIAERLAREGASVIISSRKQKNVDEAVKKLKSEGLEVVGIVCHVGKAEDRTKLFDLAVSKYGGLDILVSNAAVNPTMSAVLDTPEASWDKIFEINVKAAYLLAQEALPHLRNRGKGKIIFVTSVGAYHPNQTFQLLGAYCVSKTALLGLIKAAAVQLASDNIQVNGIAPGVVPTKFAGAITTDEFARNESLSLIPMHKFGTPQDMGATAAFLASNDSDYMTGETMTVAGGMPSRL
ncbi:uncharacterized protein [Onthophagus taurus]|uniref:uncharacterized protein isoform X1 n=1 Tax=Onthophagus taurus TaxID=166361 RepID=UPI0039BE894D